MSENIKKLKFGIFILVILVGTTVVAINWDYISNLQIQTVVEAIRSRKYISILLYWGIYALKPLLLVIPTNLLALVGGGLFGPIKAILFTSIGFLISGTIAFYLARLLGRDFVAGILKKRFSKFENLMSESGFKYLFILRLPPLIPYDPLSYACGLTNMKYKDFILASILGVIPETICYSIIGTSFKNPFSPQFVIPVVILIIGTISAKFLIGKGKKVIE
ncbi:MAG: TVP38/TMEM64 family protein [Clostridium sp.]